MIFKLEITTRETLKLEFESFAAAEVRAKEIVDEMNAQHPQGRHTTVAVIDPNAKKECFYFGCKGTGSAGHSFWAVGWQHGPYDAYNNLTPWTARHMDSGLLTNAGESDEVTGRVHSTCGTKNQRYWWAFYWWDRTGDKRGASNSGFYVSGFGPSDRDKAFAYACEKWPDVVARQKCKLVLV